MQPIQQVEHALRSTAAEGSGAWALPLSTDNADLARHVGRPSSPRQLGRRRGAIQQVLPSPQLWETVRCSEGRNVQVVGRAS